ncbi:hypothetical protein BDFB_014533, partial [Asbolus verrucosus]
ILTIEHKSFLLELYFRNGVKTGKLVFSVQARFEEFRKRLPTDADSLSYQDIHFFVKYVPFFRETGSIDKKKGIGRPKKRTPEVVERVLGLMEPTRLKSILKLSQQI